MLLLFSIKRWSVGDTPAFQHKKMEDGVIGCKKASLEMVMLFQKKGEMANDICEKPANPFGEWRCKQGLDPPYDLTNCKKKQVILLLKSPISPVFDAKRALFTLFQLFQQGFSCNFNEIHAIYSCKKVSIFGGLILMDLS